MLHGMHARTLPTSTPPPFLLLFTHLAMPRYALHPIPLTPYPEPPHPYLYPYPYSCPHTYPYPYHSRGIHLRHSPVPLLPHSPVPLLLPQTFVVQELMTGGSLEALLQVHVAAGTLLPLARVHEVMGDMACGLEAIHSRATHRDLKPANVLLDHTGRAKIGDFGLSRWGLGGWLGGCQDRAGGVGLWRWLAGWLVGWLGGWVTRLGTLGCVGRWLGGWVAGCRGR